MRSIVLFLLLLILILILILLSMSPMLARYQVLGKLKTGRSQRVAPVAGFELSLLSWAAGSLGWCL